MHDRIPRRIVIIVEIQLNRLDRKQNWDCGLPCPCTWRYGFRIINTTTSVVHFIILENKEYRKARLVGDRKRHRCTHCCFRVGSNNCGSTDHSQPKLFGISPRVRVIGGLCLHHFPIWTTTVCPQFPVVTNFLLSFIARRSNFPFVNIQKGIMKSLKKVFATGI